MKPLQKCVLTGCLLAATFGSSIKNLGFGTRVPNTTLKMPATPPIIGFTTTNAFPGLTFNSPVDITSPRGETNRLFLVEKTGRIMVITNLVNPTASVFLNLTNRTYAVDEGGILSLAFHPGFATNGYFFVFYTLKTTTAAGTGVHDRIARFSISPSDPNRAFEDSEVPLITQIRRGSTHHGGDMDFGPDGYLYISLGDESGGDDSWHNGQLIDHNFFSAILRIDVDKRPGSLVPNPHPAASTNYSIPPDNPFIGATTFNARPVNPGQVRTEFWAIGFRNPWRMSFDPVTGFLYCGDVGQASREEIDLIVKGGNYGWPIFEGTIPGSQSSPLLGKEAFIAPIFEYEHGPTNGLQTAAVMGGVVYHGTRLAQIDDHYLFADHVEGDIWAFRYDGSLVIGERRLTSAPGISAFGIDPSNGDVLLAMYYNNLIKRLDYSGTTIGTPLPPTLADTGAFENLATLTPNPGIVPYGVNVSFWSDRARKTRWFSIPKTNATITVGSNGQWRFPAGTIWIKHFDLELTNGVPESARRLETRLLVQNSTGVYGVTYRWDANQANATLVGEEGLDEPFTIHDGAATTRTQVWHYPSRSECVICHNSVAGGILGFRPEQLDGNYDYGAGDIANQLAALKRAGYFSDNAPFPSRVRALSPSTNAAISLEARVRSYLDANCAQCHQPGGLGQNTFDARIETPTSLSGLINGGLMDNGGDPENRVIKPGDPAHSMILRRISTLGSGRMPPLASRELDRENIALLNQWISTDLAKYQSYADWQIKLFGSKDAPNAQRSEDADADGASNYLEYLTGTDPLNAKDSWRVTARRAGDKVQILFDQIANRAFQVQVTANPADPSSWRPLDVPANEPVFSAFSRVAVIEDVLTGNSSKFYRVLVLEP